MVQEELILNIRANASQGINALNNMKRALGQLTMSSKNLGNAITPSQGAKALDNIIKGYNSLHDKSMALGKSVANPSFMEGLYGTWGTLKGIRNELNGVSTNTSKATKGFSRFDYVTSNLAKNGFGRSMYYQMKPFMDSSVYLSGNVVPELNKQIEGIGTTSMNIAKQGGQAFSNLNSSMMSWSGSLAGVSGQLNNVFALLGYGSVLMESLSAASIRESNKMFLGLNIGADKVRDAYNKIQDLVIRLPGNDQFLTSILTLSKAQMPTMSDEDLDKLGVATAEYYAAANAKGQFSYETEKELRGYLMSGNTLAFKNSMIAQEIDLLKNQNTIIERATALEEALRRTGFDGMATMESYANIFERFKGRIEKGFADIGDVLLPILKGFYNLYNFVDAMTFSGLTDSILLLVAGIGLFSVTMSGLSIAFNLVSSGVSVAINGVKVLSSFMPQLIGLFTGTTSAAQVMAAAVTSSVASTEQLNAARMALNSDAYLAQTGAFVGKNAYDAKQLANYRRELTEMAKLRSLGLDKHHALFGKDIPYNLTNEKLAYVATMNNTSVGKLNESHFTKDITKTLADERLTPMHYEVAIAERAAYDKTISLETYHENLNTLAKKENAIAEMENAEVRRMSIGQRITDRIESIKASAATLLDTEGKFANAAAADAQAIANAKSTGTKIADTDATAVSTLAEEGNLLARIHVRTATIAESIAKWLNIVSVDAESGSLMFNTKEKIRNSIASLRLRLASIKQAASNTWFAISQAIVNSELSLTAILMGIVTSELFIAIAAVAAFIIIFEKVGEWLGYWQDFGSMLEAIKAGLQRVWEAFWNNETVQAVINFFKSVYTLVSGLFTGFGNLLAYIFPNDGKEAFDILGGILEVVGFIGNILLSGLRGPLEAISTICEVLFAAWDNFIDSKEFMDMVKAIQEAWTELSKPFQELGGLFDELGKAWSEVWSDDKIGAKNTVNAVSSALKGIAWVISKVIVPLAKIVIAGFTPVLLLIKGIIEGITSIVKFFAWLNGNNPNQINAENYDPSYADATKAASYYNTSNNLTNSSNNLYNNNNGTYISNYYGEGAIPVKVDNVSDEKAYRMVVQGLGYNTINNTGGVKRSVN